MALSISRFLCSLTKLYLLPFVMGDKVEKICELSHITLTAAVFPGTPAMPSRGLKEADFEQITVFLSAVDITLANFNIFIHTTRAKGDSEKTVDRFFDTHK